MVATVSLEAETAAEGVLFLPKRDFMKDTAVLAREGVEGGMMTVKHQQTKQ